METVVLEILGEPASKANSRKVVKFCTRTAVIKSQKARDYVDSVRKQVKQLPKLLEGELEVRMTIYYASHRPDLDESVILDALQGLVYKNDRQVREKHVSHAIDKLNPRVVIEVKPRVQEVG